MSWSNEELAFACDEAESEVRRSQRHVPPSDSAYALYEADALKLSEAARRLRACKCQDGTPLNASSPERFEKWHEERKP